MSLFDEMLKNKDYSRLFENLPAEEKSILLNSMRKMVEEIENNFINPLKNIKNELNKNISENDK